MDGAEAGTAASPLAAWAWIRAFFTPATLFLVLNRVIGTIVLTSRSCEQRRRRAYHPHDDDDARHQERLYQQPPQQESHYYTNQPQQQEYVPPPPAPLERTSSVMDRLRSIDLYRFRSGDFPPEYASPPAAATDSQGVAAPVDEVPTEQGHYARSRSEPAPAREKKRAPPSRMKKSSSEVRKAEVARAPARVVRAAAAAVEEEDDAMEATAYGNFTPPTPPQQQEDYYQEQEEYVPPLRPAPLSRAPSVLERLRSFGLYRFRSGDLDAVDAAPTHETDAEEKKQQAAHYGRTRSEPKKKQPAPVARMSKSSSAAPKAEAAQDEDDGVDARADDFINNFRQQLQLQRLNSLLNYKEMLNRGGK